MNFDVKSVIFIFTVINGNINLLIKDNNFIEINCTQELDLLSHKYVCENIGIENIDLNQVYTYSKKEDEKIYINVLYVGLVNIDLIKLKAGFEFTQLQDLYRNNIYIEKSLEYLRKYLTLNDSIIKIYPNEFSLPEIQKLYESLLGVKIDRRNFRKKLINQDIIEPLGELSSGKMGRPASLYRFKKTDEQKILI